LRLGDLGPRHTRRPPRRGDLDVALVALSFLNLVAIATWPSWDTVPFHLISVSFALLWVLGMLWWSGPMNTARAVVLVAFGILAGILWYFGMKLWMRWFVQPLW